MVLVRTGSQLDLKLRISEIKSNFKMLVFLILELIKVLSDISFVIRKNKKYAIIGPSGSGKSTFV